MTNDHLWKSDSRKAKVAIMSLFLSAFATCLYIVRIIYTNDLYYGFLVWNLFLAWLPFVFAWLAYKCYVKGKRKFIVIFNACVWLLFFPNAPYIITDLVHIRQRQNVPLWFDATLVFSFAFVGFILGLASLYLIHRIVEKKFGMVMGWIMMINFISLGSYGIYIGRILRYNSWDIVVNTIPLAKDVGENVLSTTSVSMSIIFSALMCITYFFLFHLIRTDNRYAFKDS